MRCSIVVVVLVAVVAAQNPSALSQISALEAELASELAPPQSIIPDLLEFVPSSIIAAFGNPSLLPAIAASVAKSPPPWIESLPPAAKSYFFVAEGAYDTIEPQIASLEAIATSITAPGSNPAGSTTASTVQSTGYSNSTGPSRSSTTTKAASLTTSAVVSSSSKASSSSSSGGATNPVAAGVVGAVGILGLALAL